MKFLALLKKELRESAPWIAGAAVLFVLVGGVLLYDRIIDMRHYRPWGLDPGSSVPAYSLIEPSPLDDVASVLLVLSLALGLVLAGRQFWMPTFLRTWAFAVHRSVPRLWVLLAKLAAAAIGFVLAPGAVWTLLFLFASKTASLPYPPRPRVLAEGWLFVTLGLIAYLGTALSACRAARWYTTGTFPLAFAAGVVLLAIALPGTAVTCASLAVGLAVLLPQLVVRFGAKEF